jgi:hypothetical protein
VFIALLRNPSIHQVQIFVFNHSKMFISLERQPNLGEDVTEFGDSISFHFSSYYLYLRIVLSEILQQDDSVKNIEASNIKAVF